MESWKKVWREGLAPLIATEGLEALHAALASDDPRLIQRQTTEPLALQCDLGKAVECACPMALCGVAVLGGFGTAVLAEAQEYFDHLCAQCGWRLGDPRGVAGFVNWWDEAPRAEARALLLAEVALALAGRRPAKGVA